MITSDGQLSAYIEGRDTHRLAHIVQRKPLQHVFKLLIYVRPYWRRSVVALILLTSLVFLDLAIPRLIQQIIDQGIEKHNQQVVIQNNGHSDEVVLDGIN